MPAAAPQPSPAPFDRRRARTLAQSLVRWYESHARDLPWRRTRDPYAIWVSEVMLQQTRVETVLGRYERFLERFPDLVALANAPVADVVAEWAGLGYYRRARQLHRAAQTLVAQGARELPRTSGALRLLPGFGAYTAGAVASIAFEQTTPAVDGNVQRVVARLLGLSADPRLGEGARRVEAVARALVEQAQPSILNQALMELGATVCTPRSPRCADCPWQRRCEARKTGRPESFPRLPPRRASEIVTAYAAVLRDGDRLLWRRRPEGRINAGLWELPTTDWHPGTPDVERAPRELVALARELDLKWTVADPLTRIRHGITHHRVTFVGYEVRLDPPCVVRPGDGLQWARASEADGLGVTAASSKLIARLPTLL